ncbi:hypothetical protein [Arthrobacter sp. UYCu712]|uniref:hypothetical protein n=1 Tax=Arthrobacter sp. UYCu712 TaxID=3156340 RepID=UPI0033985C75
MGKFRGWHIVAGIAAMVLTGILGTAMGLNNTATFMSSCVAFVAVSLWFDSRISRRRREVAREVARETARRDAARDDTDEARESAPGLAFDADSPKRDGHGS